MVIRGALIFLISCLISLNAHAERQYSIYETKSGNKVSLSELANKTIQSDIIFFGEFHDDSLLHIIQKDYLSALYQLNPKIAVSLEMFERDVQPVVDDYLSDKISEDAFLKGSRPWPDYSKFYKPLVELAKANKAPVVAANIPRKYAAVYSNDGWVGIEKLPANERTMVAGEMHLREDNYQKNFNKVMLQNMGMDSNAVLTPNQENTMYLYYGAQVIKDETMGESIINCLKNNKGMKLIHFNGDFHSNSYLGTVQKVSDRNKSYKLSVIAPTYADSGKGTDFVASHKGDGDYLIVLEQKEKTVFAKNMMGGHLGENYIISHKINIKLDPSKHFIDGTDKLKFKNPVLKSCSIKMLKDLKIGNLTSSDGPVDFKINVDSLYQEIVVFPKKNEINEVNISYSGTIYHSPNITLLNQKHSNTPGIISDAKGEGIYLPAGSYFPQADKDIADFDIEITLPKELTLITSGTLVSLKEDGANKTYNYKSELPTDDMILVGGLYKSKDTVYDGKTFTLYTFENNPAFDVYLNSSVQYYKDYTKLFGPYPYSGFKIVENFFATGFGMPGYTLLSNRLMAMPFVVLAPGSLAHEFVHNWWGNSIYVDYDSGNWCEALTTFSANYYYNVLNKKPDAALDWRKKALLSLESLPEKDKYPVGKFKSQVNINDAVIGYQKGGFVFYELYKTFGDEKFFTVMKNFAQKYKGKRASWMGLTMMFGEQTRKDSSKIPVRKIFDQWLNENQIPTLTLANVKMQNDSLTFEINQDLKFYMPVPVRIITDKDTINQSFTITNSANKFAVKAANVKSVTVDPEYQCLRRLNKWEIPFSFSLTLGDNPLLIMPSKSSKEYPVAEKFAELVKESEYTMDAKSVDDLKDADWANRSIIVLGDSKSNSFYKKMQNHYPAKIDITGNEITIDKQKFPSEGNLMLLNCANPANPDKYASIIFSSNMENTDQLRRLFHYLSYSMLLVKESAKPGRPLSQMEIYPVAGDKHQLEYFFSK